MANKNITQLTPQAGSANTTSLFYAVTGGNTDTSLPLSVLFNGPIFTGTVTIPFTLSATGAAVRTVFAKLSDFVDINDFGGNGNGVTDNTTAITNAEAFGSVYVPAGTYNTTSIPSTSLTGPFWGLGQIKDSAGNKRGKVFNQLTQAPSSLGNQSSVETSFNGDLSKQPFSVEHRITGVATLGQPTTGYVYTPEAYPFWTYLYNSSGWNQTTNSNVGRTAACAYRTAVYQAGQGDAVCYNATAFVTGAKGGATNFLANPAAVLFNGDMTAGQAGVYLNPYETFITDNGFDVAGIGNVNNLNRTVNTGALSAWWGGYRVQSVGSVNIDVGFSAQGLMNFGLDLSYATLAASQAAITMKANQRIYGNVTATDSLSRFPVVTNDYISYSTSINGWNFVVANNASWQITSGQVTATVPLAPSQTGGIVGTTTNNNVNAGGVGEFISSTVLAGSAVPLTSNTVANVTSISLTAGDWDVWGNVGTGPAGTTTTSLLQVGISTTSGAFQTAPNGGALAYLPYSAPAGAPIVSPVGQMRLSLSATTTVYLVVYCTFAVSTNGAYGFIGARRRR